MRRSRQLLTLEVEKVGTTIHWKGVKRVLTAARSANFPTRLGPRQSETSLMILSTLAPGAPEVPPSILVVSVGHPLGRVSVVIDDFSWLLKRIESTLPEATASLVNALRFATRRIMRSGAMTYSSSGSASHPEIAVHQKTKPA